MMFALWFSLIHIGLKSRGPIKRTSHLRPIDIVVCGVGYWPPCVRRFTRHSKMAQWEEDASTVQCSNLRFNFFQPNTARIAHTHTTHIKMLDTKSSCGGSMIPILFFSSLLNLVFTMFFWFLQQPCFCTFIYLFSM